MTYAFKKKTKEKSDNEIQFSNESYVSIKKDVYTNLAELHSKAGDQAKAEKFKNLAETI
ncbi:MAG: hypothetical protein IMF11_22770 [Proteobacteria bacterium]|nr:hypothetical protein [Pseudomonadota bacterium]